MNSSCFNFTHSSHPKIVSLCSASSTFTLTPANMFMNSYKKKSTLFLSVALSRSKFCIYFLWLRSLSLYVYWMSAAAAWISGLYTQLFMDWICVWILVNALNTFTNFCTNLQVFNTQFNNFNTVRNNCLSDFIQTFIEWCFDFCLRDFFSLLSYGTITMSSIGLSIKFWYNIKTCTHTINRVGTI